jgi:hypothetical protein
MITYDDVKRDIPIQKVLEKYGVKLSRTYRCACPIHGGDNPDAFSVHDQGRKWTCHTKGCGKGSSVIDLVALKEGVSPHRAFIMLKEWYGLEEPEPVKNEKPFIKTGNPLVYEYFLADGSPAYKINRIEKTNGTKTRKEFFPELPDGSRTLPKEKRVLYNLPAVLNAGADYVCFCEGEKTADALIRLGFIGTTVSNGCDGWLDQYAESLSGKDVVLLPDADESGGKWHRKVSDGLRGVVKSLRTVYIPDEFVMKYPQFNGHDFADMAEVLGGEQASLWLTESIVEAHVLPKGIDRSSLNVMSDVCRDSFRTAETMTDADGMNLKSMFGLDIRVRPADMMLIIAATGVGKTRILGNLPFVYTNLNFAIFDLEMSLYQLGMRSIAYHNGMSFVECEDKIRAGGYKIEIPEVENVFLPKVASLTVDKIKKEVDRIEESQERRVDVVAVDYISKMNRMGSMTDSIISNCSDFKRYLVEENRIGVITTQSKRIADKEMKYNMPCKEDSIYTSAIEQNCQESLCFCFKEGEYNTMLCRCDKYTHGEEPHEWTELDVNNMKISYRGLYSKTENEF